jgi:hypothetical protein
MAFERREDPRYSRRFNRAADIGTELGRAPRAQFAGMLANVRDGQIEKSGEVSYVAPRSDDIILK